MAFFILGKTIIKKSTVMLIVVSPAKTLDYESPLATERFTQPETCRAVCGAYRSVPQADAC